VLVQELQEVRYPILLPNRMLRDRALSEHVAADLKPIVTVTIDAALPLQRSSNAFAPELPGQRAGGEDARALIAQAPIVPSDNTSGRTRVRSEALRRFRLSQACAQRKRDRRSAARKSVVPAVRFDRVPDNVEADRVIS